MPPDSRSQAGFRPGRDHDIPNRIPGGFTIGEEIGRGSFAVVYRGLHTPSNQSVAIKAVIKSKLTNKLFQNLQDEIKILKRIRHGNVVGLVDCISDNDYIFLVMQYCSQGDLSVYIKTQSRPNSNQLVSNDPRDKPSSSRLANRFPHPVDGGLNEWIVRSFLGQLADALQFLSSNSIIHRDIKPQNLLLHPSSPTPSSEPSQPSSPPAPGYPSTSSPNEHPIGPHRYVPEGIPILRVADFGFARVLAPNAGLAETLCGSPLYMAPEILRYEKYDAKADLWSVGAVLYEMAVGKPPFRAQNHVELLRKIEKSEDRIMFPQEKMVPEDLKRLIRCLLKRNPAERISFTDFFRLANDVSRQGPLVPPAELHRTASLPHSSRPLRPQLPTLHTAAGHHALSRRPPSTSALPDPPSPKSHRPSSSAALGGEPGAFIVDKTPALSREVSSNALQPSVQAAAGPSSAAPLVHSRRPSHTLPSPTQPSHIHPSHQAPSPSILPAPLLSTHRQSHGIPSFPAKYVILGSPNRTTSTVISTAVKAKDYALMRSPSLKSMALTTGMKSEEEEDRDLGTEYVVVEKGSVEINALVDALSSSPRKPISLGRRMSRGFMSSKPTLSALSSSPHRTLLSTSPPPSALVSTPAHAPLHAHPVPGASSFPPRPHPLPSPPATGIRPVNIASIGRSSPSSQAYYGHYPSSPQSFDSSGGGGIGSLPIVGRYFPQAHSPASAAGSPSAATQPLPRPIFPTSALCRAILSTSEPILRTTNGLGNALGINNNANANRGGSSSAGAQQNLRGPDLVESQLLSELEEVACKVVVIMQFADEKLERILPARPSAMSASGGGGGTGVGVGVGVGASGGGPVVGAFVDIKKAGLVGQAHQSGELAWSSRSGMNTVGGGGGGAGVAAEGMVLYVKALAFLDKGIRHAVAVVERKRAGEASSSSSSGGGIGGGAGICWEVGCAIEWMRTKFNEVFDKAELVRSKVVNDKIFLSSGGKTRSSGGGGNGGMGLLSVEKLIYDRALEKSRSAASTELLGINLDSCELEYEVSMWMFYALLDPTMREDEEICSSSSGEEGDGEQMGRKARKGRGRRGNEVGIEGCERLVGLVVNRLEGLRRKIKSNCDHQNHHHLR